MPRQSMLSFINRGRRGAGRGALLSFLAWGCFLFPAAPFFLPQKKKKKKKKFLTYHFLKAAAETHACLMI